MNFSQMGLNEWLLISGALLGPVLAVQAQKWVERARESDRRKSWVFYTLMATRGARLAPDHVLALNSIDLVFYGFRFGRRARRSQKAQGVVDAWREYRAHLNPPPQVSRAQTGEEMASWNAKSDELFWNLLSALAVATNHDFERQQLRTGGYSPVGHYNKEQEEDAVRTLSLEILSGQRALGMDLRTVPKNEKFLSDDAKFKADLIAAIERLAK